jgi:ribosomal protein S18 acetylase RimI-like enzyme
VNPQSGRPDLVVRRATDGDWPALWPVWQETVAGGDTYTYPPDTTYDDARRAWLPPAPAETWLASEVQAGRDVTVLGTYLLRPNFPGQGSHVANAGFMVAAAARGRGIGRFLAEHCLARAVEAGYLAMAFNAVVATNPAVRLWESLGFTVVGRVPGGFRHPRDGLVDLLVMHRDLGPRSG